MFHKKIVAGTKGAHLIDQTADDFDEAGTRIELLLMQGEKTPVGRFVDNLSTSFLTEVHSKKIRTEFYYRNDEPMKDQTKNNSTNTRIDSVVCNHLSVNRLLKVIGGSKSQ